MVLGAGRSNVISTVLARGLGVMSIGTAAGVIAAITVNRLLDSVLYGVVTTDIVTYFSVFFIFTLRYGVLLCAARRPGFEGGSHRRDEN